MHATAPTTASDSASSSAQRHKHSAIKLFNAGLWEPSLVEFDRAVAQTPTDTELHNYRARVLDELGRHEQALQAIEDALAINPTDAADLKNRGVLLRKLGRLAQALTSFEAALAQRPGDLDLLLKHAQLLNDLDRREEALGRTQQAVALEPENLLALNARGVILENLGRYDEAMADFERMLETQPGHVDAINNCGMVLARQGHFGRALEAYDRSLAIEPDQAQAFYNRSLVRLALGDWPLGLREFESRWQLPPLKATLPQTSAPLWSGQGSLAGKTLFVHHEQGYGDTLQCVRFVPLLAGLGAKVILAVPPALRRLMGSLPGDPVIVSSGEPLPAHDLQSPLMSLLLALGTTPQTIPADVPYLKAAPEDVPRWNARVGSRKRPRIGLVWSGRRYAPINHPRDMRLAMLKPLLEFDAEFVSLQQDMAEEDRAMLAGLPALNARAAADLDDFADTAALIETLDLVISVDTAVAHLAGAMGKPVWLMNRHASCWRWLQEGADSAWYPSMRIFRQRRVGDWGGLVMEVCAAAEQFIGKLASAGPGPAVGLIGLKRADDAVEIARAGPAPTSLPRRVERGGAQAVPADTIRFVCATRHTSAEFFAKAPLGRSLPLYQTFPRRQRIELRLFPSNAQGLPSVYNVAIEEAKTAPAILVFIHDDLYLSDYYWADHLLEGLRSFDIVGLAGNKRRAKGQASWMYLDDQFRSDSYDNLSGVLGHGEGFPNLKQLSVYGDPGQEVKLLDGVMLAVRSEVLQKSGLRFDTRFEFDFYDLDFCRQAEARGVRMGTWAISAIHASAGNLGGSGWRVAYGNYLQKYGDL